MVAQQAVALKCTVAKITSYVKSCLLKCFVVYLLWKLSRKSWLTSLIFNSQIIWVTPLLGRQYMPLQKLKTCYNNFLLQPKGKRHEAATILSKCVGAHYYVMWETVWSLMAAMLRNNRHHKEESKLKLQENTAFTWAFYMNHAHHPCTSLLYIQYLLYCMITG